jgi:hypothetical protein
LVDATTGNITTGLANANSAGAAYWNVPAGGFAAKQVAAFTILNGTFVGDALVLKATGGVATAPASFIRVRLTAGSVVVETTTTLGLTYTTAGTLAGALANGDTLIALADATGTVFVWKTTGATTTYLGSAATTFTGTGRIGIQLPTNARVDNFAGGTAP